MRTAAFVVVTVVLSLLAVLRVGRWAMAEPAPPVLPAPRVAPSTTTTTTWDPRPTPTFVTGPVVSFSRPAPTSTTTTTAAAPRAPAAPPARAAASGGWTWDRLADCETGVWGPGKVPIPGTARWDATRGIYQGGLQFDARTWDGFRVGFPGFPADAHLATRAQQIAVAERVLAAQGAKAWPTCGPRVGLTGSATTSVTLPPAGPPEHEPD